MPKLELTLSQMKVMSKELIVDESSKFRTRSPMAM